MGREVFKLYCAMAAAKMLHTELCDNIFAEKSKLQMKS